jgi:hypothetical protein
VAFMTATQSVASFSGAVLGGILIDSLGIQGVLVLTAGGYLISAFCNWGVLPNEAASSQTGGEMKAGWEILNDRPGLRKILIGFGFVNFFSMPTLVIMPLYVKNALQGSATMLGLLEACLWAGLIGGSLASKWVPGGTKSLHVGSACLLFFGACLSLPGFIVNAVLYGVLLFFAGMAMGINNVKFVSLFQETVDSKIKGRFFALMQALIGFGAPAAYFTFGFIGDTLGPVRGSLIQGAGVMTLAFYFMWLAKEQVLRKDHKLLHDNRAETFNAPDSATEVVG